MTRSIFSFEQEGKAVLGFDTALNSRSFAQAKFAFFMSEAGLIVYPDGRKENWNAQGVTETPDGSMVIWGPPFEGKRLDLLVSGAKKDDALAALARWLEALCGVGESPVSLYPFVALVADNGAVLFCPENLAKRCVAFNDGGRYVHPDLTGTAAMAFTAAAMLYRLLAETPPFDATDAITLHQDMREANFLPLRLAAPGLDENLAALVQQALSLNKELSLDKAPPNQTRLVNSTVAGRAEPGKYILDRIKEALDPRGQGSARAASFFRSLPDDERAGIIKERERFARQKELKTKTRRFVMRNAAIILGCAVALLVAVLVARSIVKSRAELPTTRGMDSQTVVAAYYNAFGELDHSMMDACLAKGANRDDVSMVINLFVINKVRQAYEMNGAPVYLTAKEWKERGGGPAEAQVFGITDLSVERLAGGEEMDETRWRARYTFWAPFDGNAPEGEAAGTPALPQGINRIDTLTLTRRRGNWQISAMERLTESLQSSD